MENNFFEKVSGTRVAGKSLRFSHFPPAQTSVAIREPLDNMFSYGHTYGKISITNNPNGTQRITFYNNALSENLPSLEMIQNMCRESGENISAKKGISIKGEGIEALGISARSRKDSIVTATIKVCKDGKSYGAVMVFDGKAQDVCYECSNKEINTDKPNSFEIEYDNVYALTNNNIKVLKQQLSSQLGSLPNFTVEFWDDKGCEVIKPSDMMYSPVLDGSDKYKKKTFHFKKNGKNEYFTYECSDVSKVARSTRANYIDKEYKSKCPPEFAGVSVNVDGLTTTNFGKSSWSKTIGYKYHSTQNAIRIKLTIGKEMFEHMYSESPIKTEATLPFFTILDEFNVPVKFYDMDGNEYSGNDIKNEICEFIRLHDSDTPTKEKEERVNEAIKTNIEMLAEKIGMTEAIEFYKKSFANFMGCKEPLNSINDRLNKMYN